MYEWVNRIEKEVDTAAAKGRAERLDGKCNQITFGFFLGGVCCGTFVFCMTVLVPSMRSKEMKNRSP
jgi:hypothetical protein